MVQNEIDNVQQLGNFVDVIVGADATRDAVLHGLQQHSWVHFACHGHMGDDSQPFHGDDRLTLLNLIPVKLPNAEFAFLAACHTAAGDPNTPDETIHLAAALQFCGFQSVVGTLWATADKAGPIFQRNFTSTCSATRGEWGACERFSKGSQRCYSGIVEGTCTYGRLDRICPHWRLTMIDVPPTAKFQ